VVDKSKNGVDTTWKKYLVARDTLCQGIFEVLVFLHRLLFTEQIRELIVILIDSFIAWPHLKANMLIIIPKTLYHL
jgi:hypothetical protein